jgi:DNA repair photolyase
MPRPERIGPARVSFIDTAHLLTPGKGRTSSFDYTLNPYRGCSFGCSYCYAAFFEPDEAKRRDWGNWVEVKHRALAALSKADLRDKRVYMSSVTDPYQPIEMQVGLTREIVEHLAASGARLVVQTRSPFVTRDIDVFQRFEHLRVNVSITTDSDAVRKRYEPGCASVGRRLDAVRQMCEAGLKVRVCVCPMLPMENPVKFGRLLDEIGVHAVTASYFHSTGRAAFAANTREGAFALSEDDGWTEERMRDCAAALSRSCRSYGSSEMAFGPV